MTERLIAGRFLLADALGSGGMGTVWRAHDQLLGRKVALKEVQLPSNLAASEREEVRERVIREGRAAAKLSHACAVIVFDVIEEGDNIFLAMELVESPTLGQVVAQNGPLTPVQAAKTGLAVLGALEAAHAAGIVHRDVKPANIMMDGADRIKLADFGIASIKGDPRLTSTGMVIGSPSYMSPEQASGKDAGPASDLWSLGATLYFATEGVGPFDRSGPMPTLLAITSDDAPPAEHAGPLTAAIGLLLSKDPGLRPSAAELRPVLEKVALGGGLPTAAATVMNAPLPHDTLQEQKLPVRAAVLVQGAEPARDVVGRTVPASAERTLREPISPPPPSPSTSPAGKSANRWIIPAAMIALLLLLGVFFVPKLFNQAGSGAAESVPTTGPPTSTTAEPSTAPAPTSPDKKDKKSEASAPIAAGWARQTLGDTGYGIDHPQSWSVVENPLREGSSMRFNGPNGQYLLVDWTNQPGDDAAAAWEQQAASFARRRENYRQIQITPTEFQDFDTAALWEWTYSSAGAELHAANLGFADDAWGFALNFQTRVADWEAAQPIFQQFKESFSAG